MSWWNLWNLKTFFSFWAPGSNLSFRCLFQMYWIYIWWLSNYSKMITSFQWNSDKQVGAENPKCISKISGILLYLGYNSGGKTSTFKKDDCSSWVIFMNSRKHLSSQSSVVSNSVSRELSLLLFSPWNIK